jgi:glycosyltransferase involved in cell wall biosynthesis
LLAAARLLENLDPSVHFLLVGGGPVKAELQKQAASCQLKNVTFIPPQPRETIPGYLSAGDVALVPLTRQRLIGALPSKMFDAMACERPVILSAEGEASQVLHKTGAGVVVPPEDPPALAKAVLELSNDSVRYAQYGKNGRQAVIRGYSRQVQAQQLVGVLDWILQKS